MTETDDLPAASERRGGSHPNDDPRITIMDPKELATKVNELTEVSKKNSDAITTLTKSVGTLVDTMAKTPLGGQPTPNQMFNYPHIRDGENPLTSRGFSFMKMLGLVSGQVSPDQAKVEIDLHNKLNKHLCEGMGQSGYQYKGQGIVGAPMGKFLAPLSTSFFQDDVVDRPFRREMKALVRAGLDGVDQDEMNWIRRKQLTSNGYNAKALSWLNDLTGGSLVAPPEFGELIELLRNKEALVNAGARVVPLPPQGRVVYPRQTAASSTYWVGENSPITDSNIGTGEVILQAKKLAVMIKAPNELIRFASPAAEALMRDDMTKSLALGLDLAGLEGSGGDTKPRGLTLMKDIYRLTSSAPGPDGDKLVGQDIYRFVAAVEEANAEFEGFIMRPKTLYKYYQLRADAVAQGDSSGMFLFNLIREPGDGVQATLAGYPVTKSTQISQVQTKGNGTGLTYIVGGMWSDLLIGMFGAIEFAATAVGDTAFTNDQTWVRGILSADIAARHESAFVVMNNLDLGL